MYMFVSGEREGIIFSAKLLHNSALGAFSLQFTSSIRYSSTIFAFSILALNSLTAISYFSFHSLAFFHANWACPWASASLASLHESLKQFHLNLVFNCLLLIPCLFVFYPPFQGFLLCRIQHFKWTRIPLIQWAAFPHQISYMAIVTFRDLI